MPSARSLAVVVVVVGVAAFVTFGGSSDVEADVGRPVETDLGIVTVHGWTADGNETLVSIAACPNSSGTTIDQRALRIGSGEAEVEASGSQLGVAGDGQPGCVRGSVRFPSIAPTDRVVYLASPRVIWRAPAAAVSPSAS